MRRWLIIGAIVLVALLVFGWLYSEGYFEGVSWQGLTILFASLAAPFQFIFGKAKDISKTEEFINHNLAVKKEEKEHRVKYDEIIEGREQKINDLDREIQLLQSKLELVDKKRERVEEEVQNMSPKEKTKEAQDLWGD
ncbi:MAG: hypothetical protein KAI79_06055 [Bacteroidales bacterium]|nr:hypothetical protein [Bacteroidales bacterium]